MFRALLLLLGLAITTLVALYFLTRRTRYLAWARWLLLAGLLLGTLFFLVLLFKRLI
jgi:hypothetical protein